MPPAGDPAAGRDWSRRRLLPAMAAALAAPAGARASLLPGTATLLAPGPEETAAAALAARFAAALGRGASSAVHIRVELLGGADGVTAANRFAAAATPDGRYLLQLAGGAAQARLIGDPRARFDLAGLLPVAALRGGLVLAGRGPAPLGSGQPLRLALGAAEAGESCALLACDMVGLPAQPLLGLSPAQAEAALAAGEVQAIVLRGGQLPQRLQALGAQAWWLLDGSAGRDAALPGIPALPELVGAVQAPLLDGFRAAAASAATMAALVLPALTPAATVAPWRAAAQRWQEEEARTAGGFRPVSAEDAMRCLAALAPPPEAARAYRGWMQQRLGWQPE